MQHLISYENRIARGRRASGRRICQMVPKIQLLKNKLEGIRKWPEKYEETSEEVELEIIDLCDWLSDKMSGVNERILESLDSPGS